MYRMITRQISSNGVIMPCTVPIVWVKPGLAMLLPVDVESMAIDSRDMRVLQVI